MAYRQNLDNGVMRKPSSSFTGSRTSKSMDFEAVIAKGENPNGQTTIALTEVSRGGQPAGYKNYRPGKGTEGDRWNSNPDKYDEP